MMFEDILEPEPTILCLCLYKMFDWEEKWKCSHYEPQGTTIDGCFYLAEDNICGR